MDLLKLLRREGPASGVSLKWLLRRTTTINRRFAKGASVSTRIVDGFKVVKVNSLQFVWPEEAPIDDLVTIASEHSNPQHPHQYLWGKTVVSSGDVVIDIGACEGRFAATAAKLGGRLVCIEPSRTMQRVILKLFELEGLGPPVIVGVLAGDREGHCHFVDNPRHPGASRVVERAVSGSYPVEQKPLDLVVEELKLEKVDFIKCDAEGAEASIVLGALQTLRRFRPKLSFCTYHNDNDFAVISGMIAPLGYHVQGKGFLRGPNGFRVHHLHAW